MASPLIAIIAGVGPGVGASVARKFAAAYPVVLLARKASSYEQLAKEINDNGGKAIGIETDVSQRQSVSRAVTTIKREFGEDVAAAAGIVNASGSFSRGSALDISVEAFDATWAVSGRGSLLLSQAVLPLLLKGVETGSKYPPSLIFTGATASVRGGALFAGFAPQMWAKRALAQSLAREFGPKGIHVAHAIMDGGIESDRARETLGDNGPDSMISPDAIAESYWNLHTQPRSAFTWEIDLRPWVEKW